MIDFIGEYGVKVDDKGRIIFPSAFKALMASGHEEPDMRFVVKASIFAGCLEMYTYSEWVARSEEVRSRLNFFNREHALFWREYMRGTAIVEPSGNLGRITIPKELMSFAKIGREAVFHGCNHMIEIWPKDVYEAQKLSRDAYEALAEKILG